MSALHVIQNHSDTALEGILKQLGNYVPSYQDSRWVTEKRQMVRREIARRKEEDEKGFQ